MIKIGFYDDKKKAFIRLKELLKKSAEPLLIDKLILDLTEAFSVSDRAIRKRLEIMENVGDVEIQGGKMVQWVQR